MSERIALFGTSADPPTRAHQRLLLWLSQHYDRVLAWASDNPFKQHGASLEQRLEMLRRLGHDWPRPPANLSIDPRLAHPRTLDTLTTARHLWPEARFTVVIGSDLVAQLPRWYRVGDWLGQVDLLVVPRPGYPLAPPDLQALEQQGARVAIAPIEGPAIASSSYRRTGDASLLPDSVAAYIRNQGLYGCCAGNR